MTFHSVEIAIDCYLINSGYITVFNLISQRIKLTQYVS